VIYGTRGFSEGDLEDATGAEGESSQSRRRVVVRKKYVGRKHLADGKQQGLSRYSGPLENGVSSPKALAIEKNIQGG
jgi:hypothetical protein